MWNDVIDGEMFFELTAVGSFFVVNLVDVDGVGV